VESHLQFKYLQQGESVVTARCPIRKRSGGRDAPRGTSTGHLMTAWMQAAALPVSRASTSPRMVLPHAAQGIDVRTFPKVFIAFRVRFFSPPGRDPSAPGKERNAHNDDGRGQDGEGVVSPSKRRRTLQLLLRTIDHLFPGL
jgi:hypothetical protein